MSDVVDNYIERVKAHLEGLPLRERLPFICAQRTSWLVEYARFERRMGAGEKADPGESAATYLLGIAELGKLKGIEERKALVIPTEANQ